VNNFVTPVAVTLTGLFFARRSFLSMWHVIHTAPHGETPLGKYLSLQGIVTYAPAFPNAAGTRPGSVRDRRPRRVFPGYLFIQPPPGFHQWDAIRWAPGVRRLLQVDGAPAVVLESVIEHLRRRLAERLLLPARPRFRPGDRVVVQEGPLAMVDAIFDRDLNAPTRVQILVNLLGRPMKVRVDPAVLATA
jgi:transcription antitermination factor NusG